jgi:hypothetical protein
VRFRLFTRFRRARAARAEEVLPAEPAPIQPPEPAPADALVARGLGEPAAPGTADDAELDTLRGELVRELDRIAAREGR